MNAHTMSRSITLSIIGAALAFGTEALAQDVSTTTTTSQPAAPTTTVVQPAPAPQTNVTIAQPAPAATTTTTSAPVFTGTKQVEETESGYAPNRWMLTSGLVVFGVPYVSSVIVGAASGHQGDGHLYVPFAGPWMDMADRGPTNGSDSEATNKVLLGVDGVFQAIGGLEIIGALIFPETKTVTTVPATAYTPEMVVSPTRLGYNGYGLAAVGSF